MRRLVQYESRERRRHVVIIIPTYNEVENIGPILKALQKFGFPILVVDDNSPDGTGKIAAEYQGVRVLKGPRKGLGVAMARGISFALEKMKADVIITNEADFGFSPDLVPELLKKINQGCDVVIASRHVGNGKATGWTWERRFNHFVSNTIFADWIGGVRQVKDHNGACRAVRVKILKEINWNNMPEGFGFFNYWLFKMLQKTDKVCEVPATYKFRTRGKSKIGGAYLKNVAEYIKICIYENRHP